MVNSNHKIDDNHCSPRETKRTTTKKAPPRMGWFGMLLQNTINFKNIYFFFLKLDLCSFYITY